MSAFDAVASSAPALGWILLAMGVIAVVEVAIPLRQAPRWPHVAPNLALTCLTFAINLVFNAGLVLALAEANERGFGLLPGFGLPPLVSGTLGVILLDLSFYAAHVSMHRIPAFWRFHRVHHSDAAVDVTTTIRQHPGEGVIRFAFLGACVAVVGPSAAAFAVYRAASALNGLLEHANIRVPARLDRALSLVTTWPNFHKVHHSRLRAQTDSNFSNLFSVWDRLFGTCTPSSAGTSVAYGLESFDPPHTTRGLLLSPWCADAIAPSAEQASSSGAVSGPTRRRLV
jgi:sterol desaturase/sphingolipid hydroxylase (fatty acid hydroxylase superfamily)